MMKQGRVPLRRQILTPGVQNRYHLCVSKLLDYWEGKATTLHEPEEYDAGLAEYIEHLWQGLEPHWLAVNAFAGLVHYEPTLRNRLPRSKALLAAWQKMCPPARATPMLPEILLGLAGAALDLGRLDVAVCLCMGFEGLLRPIEIYSLKFENIRICNGRAIVRIVKPKVGQRHGVEELAVIQGPTVLRLLRALARERKPHEPLFRGTPDKARRWLHFLLQIFGLQGMGFSMHSLRRGGATALFEQCLSLEATLQAGRWSSSKTAQMYLCHTIAESVRVQLNTGQAALLSEAATVLTQCARR